MQIYVSKCAAKTCKSMTSTLPLGIFLKKIINSLPAGFGGELLRTSTNTKIVITSERAFVAKEPVGA